MEELDACYLVLDQGGHASRAVIFNSQGQVLDVEERAVRTLCASQETIEQDPIELVLTLREAAKTVVARLSKSNQSLLKSAALICQRSSIAVWNRNTFEPLYNVISWQDRRAANWLDELLQKQSGLAQQIHERTGLIPNAHFGASKIRWVLDNVPEAGEALKHHQLYCAPLAAYLVSQLTTQRRVMLDAGNASRSMLWDIERLCWDDDLLTCFGIPASVLPSVHPTLHEYGQLDLGRCQLPLSYVNGDQNAAFFAYGAMQRHTAYINMGTGAFCAVLNEKVRSDRLLKTLALWNTVPVVLLEGTVNGAACALDWAAQELGVSIDYALLDRTLEQAARVEHGPLFLNGIGGLGSPYWCSDFSSRFIGGGDTTSQLVAVAESILFMLQKNIDHMLEIGVRIDKVVVGGGLSRSSALCQSMSDLSGYPVHRSQVVEASARGAAFHLAACPEAWHHRKRAADFTPRNEFIKGRYRLWLDEMEQQLTGF